MKSGGWQRRKIEASHADDWLMTYADMITLLLCFFVVFLIVSMSKKELPHPDGQPVAQVTKPLVPQKPQPTEVAALVPADPFQGNLPFHDFDPEDYPEQTAPPVAALGQQEVPPPVEVTPPPVAADTSIAVAVAASVVVDGPPPVIDNAKPASTPSEAKGDRITTIEMNSATFFDSGSATLSAGGKDVLRGVADRLKAPAYDTYRITIEGHTDDSPISTPQFPSNWELSTARASAVVHFFLDEGLPADHLRAAGYADTFPKLPNRDAEGKPIPDNQAQNRRVVIKLEKIEKTDASAGDEAFPHL